MKSVFSAIAAKWLLLGIVALVVPDAGAAQNADAEAAGYGRSESGFSSTPFRTYSECAIDMFFNRVRNRGIGISINPDEYVVGPGDQFTVFFVSGVMDSITCRIKIGGKLFVKSVGPIDVAGITLSETMQRIESAVQRNYAGTDFDVQLTDFRFVQINVIGEVARPGIYYAPAIWRVSEVIDLAGGLLPNASSRRIMLRGDNRELRVDLVRFGAVGDPKANPFICNGHTIIVPDRRMSDETVSISGLVNRPGIFTAIGGDRISDYIAYAHGVKGNVSDMMILVLSEKGDITDRLDGAASATLDFIPVPGDNITLVSKTGRETFGNVVVFGEVAHPGKYPLAHQGFSLDDLLGRCGGVTPEGYPEMIQVYRLTWNHNTGGRSPQNPGHGFAPVAGDYSLVSSGPDRPGLISFNPRRPRDHSQMILADGDSIYVPRATGMVAVTGAVASPGLIRFQRGKDADYYLRQAGGAGFDADQERMVVINPVTGGGIGADEAGNLFDGEILHVPRKENGIKP